MRGATKAQDLSDAAELISIHAPHARSDTRSMRRPFDASTFQSTLLMRGATRQSLVVYRGALLFQSTLLMRGATLLQVDGGTKDKISIHAPHARSDEKAGYGQEFIIFQSTLLMRGATRMQCWQ